MSVTLLEQLSGEILRAARVDGADVQLARIGLRRLDNVLQRFQRRVGVGHDQQIEERHRRGRGEVLEDVVGQRLEQRHRDGVVVAGHQDVVAVGRGGRDRLGGDDAGGAGPVLDHDILLQPDRQLFRHDAHADIGDAARAIGHDELDWTIGIVGLGAGRRGDSACRENRAKKRAASDHLKSPPRPRCGWAHCFTALATVKHGLPRCRTSVNRMMKRAMRSRDAHGTDMILRPTQQFGWLLAAALCGLSLSGLALPSFAQGTVEKEKPAARAGHGGAIEAYIRARRAYEDEASAYWQSVVDKRRGRNAKRRNNETIVLNDYVLTQPPVYIGPPRPPGYVPPHRDPEQPRLPIPGIADFLAAAAAHYSFVPDRPKTEIEFKQAYARAASAAGLTKDQAVRIYAFETGGNGTYDGQARHRRQPQGRASDLAGGGLQPVAQHQHRQPAGRARRQVRRGAEGIRRGAGRTGAQAFDHKIAALRKMIAFSRTVPNAWSEHDKLAKTTQAAWAFTPRCSTATSARCCRPRSCSIRCVFAKMKGTTRPLTAAELELMNFTGDGNGYDLVTMPLEMRDKVPTSNFLPARRLRAQSDRARGPARSRRGYKTIGPRWTTPRQAQGARETGGAF
jgi:hypothetical protein